MFSFAGFQMIAAYLGITAASGYIYYLTWKEIYHDEIEMRSGRLALAAMLQAERDREYLKQIRRNRDEEESLMANVKGWKVRSFRCTSPFSLLMFRNTLIGWHLVWRTNVQNVTG